MHQLIRCEDGAALPVAMLTLVVLGGLSAVIAASAMNSSTTSNRDRNAKAALAAANAGVQSARYRMGRTPTQTQSASDAKCFTTTWVSPTGGICPPQTESLGNKASYTYRVSPALASTDGCTGLWVQAAAGNNVDQRCITATGTVNGVTRRVQERVVGYEFVWPNGILALGTMTTSGTLNMTGEVFANGNPNLNGTSVTGTLHYNQGSTVSNFTCGTGCQQIAEPSPIAPFTAPAVNGQEYADARASNNNAAITAAFGSNWNATNREVTGGGAGTSASPVIISSGTYYFCDIRLTNPAYFRLAPGAQVRFFIDSPYRTGSGCRSNKGNFVASNTMSFHNPSGDPLALRFDFYGQPGSANPNSDITFSNNVNTATNPFAGLIFAPNSNFTTTNNTVMTGSVVARRVTSSNTLTFTGNAGDVGAMRHYYPSDWHECPPVPSGPDPASGCY